MPSLAPYEIHITGSDAETLMFQISLEMTDGSAFPFEDYAFSYAVKHPGERWRDIVGTEADGIVIEAPLVKFTWPHRLRAGAYVHGCRIRNLASGDTTQVFTGSITISEGPF